MHIPPSVFGLNITVSLIILAAQVAIVILIIIKKRLHTQRYYIVRSVAIADIVFIINALILIIREFVRGHIRHDLIEEISSGMAMSALLTSIFTTSLLTLDRYIAVSRGLRYYIIVTKKKSCSHVTSFGSIFCSNSSLNRI